MESFGPTGPTPGPVTKDGKKAVPATYLGTIKGKALHLEIVLANNNTVAGTYDLVRGQAGRVLNCR